jgi:nucleoid DNA-binding protein
MTQRELVAHVAAAAGITKKLAAEVLGHAFTRIGEAVLVDHERIGIGGFGVFERRSRKARRILHPKTREPMRLPRSYAVGFSASKHQRIATKKS